MPTDKTLYVREPIEDIVRAGIMGEFKHYMHRPATTDEIIAAIECADMEIDLEARGASAYGVSGRYYFYRDRWMRDQYEVHFEPYKEGSDYRTIVGMCLSPEQATDAMNQHNRTKFFEIVNAWSKR